MNEPVTPPEPTQNSTQSAAVSQQGPIDLLENCCAAIQEYEGWGAPGSTINGVHYPNGTPAYRNNNPGNIRCSAVMNALATGCDPDGFCVFPSGAVGMEALKTGITDVANGTSATYTALAKKEFNVANCANLTLRQFFAIRDPSSDDNDPDKYAQFVGIKLGVDYQTFQMHQLL